VQARPVVALADRAALDPAVAGAKTAAWARAISAGLPTLAGLVITTGSREITQLDAALAAWRSLTPDEAPVVVSSSSPVEDGAGSSMAGAFTSVLDVRSERAFLTVQQVLESARIGGIRAPMAVLVQPFVAAEWGGVLFTADPITGRAGGRRERHPCRCRPADAARSARRRRRTRRSRAAGTGGAGARATAHRRSSAAARPGRREHGVDRHRPPQGVGAGRAAPAGAVGAGADRPGRVGTRPAARGGRVAPDPGERSTAYAGRAARRAHRPRGAPDLARRSDGEGGPLHAAFRLGEDGTPMPLTAAPAPGAVGAGGGLGRGPVHRHTTHPRVRCSSSAISTRGWHVHCTAASVPTPSWSLSGLREFRDRVSQRRPGLCLHVEHDDAEEDETMSDFHAVADRLEIQVGTGIRNGRSGARTPRRLL
jgi:hypothetical protein